MAYFLLGTLFKGEEYPKVPPELAADVGWLVFAGCALALLTLWFRAPSLRRAVCALEDPRTYAVLRIGFALMTLVCFLNLAPYWDMLLSDEGVFDLEYAQDRMGRTALRGWSHEEGFFDVWAVLCFLWNKPSLFYIYGSPAFVAGYMAAFFAVLLLYAAGVCSRVTGVLSWLLMSGIYNRNSLYWEGTDTVYRAFWFILLFAKTGHAWSFDNWWRCRRQRAQGVGVVVYRRVPAWPRYLMMLQLVAIYVTTGWLKTGSVWHQGDALYYALNMDHFYRFEYVTQWVSSVFGLNLFRLNTWVVHWWERMFFLVFVGVILRFHLRHRGAPWYRREYTPWRTWGSRGALLCTYAVVYAIVAISVPYCLPMRNDKPTDPTAVLTAVHIGLGGVVPLLALAWYLLGRAPVRLLAREAQVRDLSGALMRRFGRVPGPPRGGLLGRLGNLRLPALTFGQDALRKLLVGRLIWLALGAMFHGFLILFMNIGMFPFIMLMTYAAYVEGDEFARIFGRANVWLGERLPRLQPALARLQPRFEPAEPATAIPVAGRSVPDGILFAFGVVGLALVWGESEHVKWIGTATYWWLGTIAVVSLAFRLVPALPRSPDDVPLAYGALGRALAVGMFCWHAGAVTMTLFPTFPMFSQVRSAARPVFGTWLAGTGTTQSWSMFAPNPPRGNTFMKTVVVTQSGERWDLRSNAFHYWLPTGPSSRPNPWILNDRMRKMHRRMVDKGKWYLKYWAQYHCRQWALTHDGEMPLEIDVRKLSSRIPPPTFISYFVPAKHKGRKDTAIGAISGQPYDPRKLKVNETHVQTNKCEVATALPPVIKLRYGLPLTEAEQAKLTSTAEKQHKDSQQRREAWDKRRDYGRWWAYERERAQRDAENEAKRAAAKARRDELGRQSASKPDAEGSDDDSV